MVLNYYETRSGLSSEPTKQKDVIFIDYDGTEVFSCSKEELGHTRLPDNPSHSGLIAQGWNWTLPQIMKQLEECPGVPVYVGQFYATESGATEVDILLTNERKKPTVTFQNTLEPTTIDWGDGNIESYTASNTTRVISHEYASGGSYTIKFSAQDGLQFNGNNVSGFIRDAGAAENPNDTYAATVQNIRIGDYLSFSYRSLFNFCSLKTITMSKNAIALSNQVITSGYALQSITFNPNCSFALENSYNLKNASLPYGLTSLVHNSMFSNCYSLEYITIPITVESISSDGRMFGNCYSLKKMVFPKTITQFNQISLYNCHNLKSVVFLGNAPIIGIVNFHDCFLIENLVVPGGISQLATGNNNSSFNACNLIKNIPLSDSITTIPQDSFKSCRALAEFYVPSSVVSIGTSAFENCTRLRTIILPEGLETIGQRAFRECFFLDVLTIPSTVTEIGNNAFQNCTSMMEYHILPTTPPALGTEAFLYIRSTATIYVPRGCLTAYQTATNWSEYASYMQEEPA